MKKLALLVSGLLALGTASAQQLGSVTLSGTSYTQGFDTLNNGLPVGWHVFTAANISSLGYLRDTSVKLYIAPSSIVKWINTTGGFKNVASGNNTTTFSPFAQDSLAQATATDRALAVRQVAKTNATFPGSDSSGASFSLKLANTAGLNNFAMSFKLQSLDSSSRRRTTWAVDYGFGDNPTTFTATGTTGTTGAYTFSNNTLNVNFGTALDNQAGPVWIRVVTLIASDTLNTSGTAPTPTGVGNRATSAIDDVQLTWSTTGSTCPVPVGLTATNVTDQSAQLDWNGNNASYEYVLDGNSANPTTAGTVQTTTTATISGLAANTMYYFHLRGICGAGDTSAWVSTLFTTLNNVGIANVKNNGAALSVLGYPTTGSMTLAFTLKQAGNTAVTITDLAGRTIYSSTIAAVAGTQQQSLSGLNLVPGMYLVRISNGKETGAIKTSVR